MSGPVCLGGLQSPVSYIYSTLMERYRDRVNESRSLMSSAPPAHQPWRFFYDVRAIISSVATRTTAALRIQLRSGSLDVAAGLAQRSSAVVILGRNLLGVLLMLAICVSDQLLLSWPDCRPYWRLYSIVCHPRRRRRRR